MKGNREYFEWKCGFVNTVRAKGWDKALAEFRKEFGITEAKAKEWWAWYEREILVPEVCYEADGASEVLTGVPGRAPAVETLPLVARGVKKAMFRGKVYTFDREGLYRFTTISDSVRNVIAIRDGDSVMPVLKALALMQIHGNRDSAADLPARRKLLLSRYWISLTCGCISALTKDVLETAGFKARLVSSMTLRDWNTYNNGHVSLEVFFPDLARWVYVDVDMGYVFMHNGELLDCLGFWRCVREDRQPTFVPLAPKEVDPLWLEGNNYSYAFYWRRTVPDIPAKWNWYRRVFEVFGFNEKDRTVYMASGKAAERVQEYRGHYAKMLAEAAFVKKFYA
jgi:hypothetical protein